MIRFFAPRKANEKFAFLFLLTTLFLPEILSAQDSIPGFTPGYQWEKNPVLHNLDSAESAARAVFILDFRQYNYHYDDEGSLLVDYTEHNIIRVNTSVSVEEHNKVYISLNGTVELLSIQARSIGPDGIVSELSRENIREIDNLENAGAFRIFAIEGLIPGGEVEYAYTVRQMPRYYGREVLQRDIPVRKAVIEILAPAHLLFETRSYNGLAYATDSLIRLNRRTRSVTTDLPAALTERYARYQPHLQRIEFKLGANLYANTEPLFNWEMAATRYREMVYLWNKDDGKSVRTLLKELDIQTMDDPEDQIRTIERYLKGQIALQEGEGQEFEEPARILKNRHANEYGLLCLTAACLKLAEISHELVIGSDRYGFPFDPGFETWTFLEEPFFYFPFTKKFLAPAALEYRYGTIPFAWTGGQALFVETESEGEKAGFSLGSISEPILSENYDDINITVMFDTESAEVQLDVMRSMTGYRASFIQPFLELLPEETQSEVARDLLLSSSADAQVLNKSFENATLDDVYSGEPLILRGSLKSSSLVEKAGNRLLFKVGEVIGPQVEMYQSGPRQYDIDLQYAHGYHRDILLRAPKGYRFKGTEDLAMNISYPDQQGLPWMGFVSEYTFQGNDLLVKMHEFYATTTVPLTRFDDFRKVINAAADFNKITILLEPD